MNKLICFLAVLFLVLSTLFGHNIESKQFDIGVSYGVLLPGSFDASYNSDFDTANSISAKTEASGMLRAYCDYYLLPCLAVGASFSYAGITPVDDIYWDDNGPHHIGKNDLSIFDACLGIKHGK